MFLFFLWPSSEELTGSLGVQQITVLCITGMFNKAPFLLVHTVFLFFPSLFELNNMLPYNKLNMSVLVIVTCFVKHLHFIIFFPVGKHDCTELYAECLQISYVEVNMAKVLAFAS